MLSFPTVFSTPDKADSIANGTKIFPWKDAGISSASDLASIVYCQRPLRLCQSLLCICGLGYSGNMFLGFTLSAHCVVIRPGTIFQLPSCALAKIVVIRTANNN